MGANFPAFALTRNHSKLTIGFRSCLARSYFTEAVVAATQTSK
jgi:hypothetical protein